MRKIANMYEGEATVQSEPGVGSTFTVTLHDARRTGRAPVADAARPDRRRAAALAAAALDQPAPPA